MSDIKHSLIIHAVPRVVFDAISTIGGLSAWWTPDVKGSNVVGESLYFYFGKTYYKRMTVTKQETGKMVAWRCDEGVPEWINTLITFDVRETDGYCRLFFNHDKWSGYSPMFYQCSYDWAMFLRSLKKYCESGTGSPYPGQHA